MFLFLMWFNLDEFVLRLVLFDFLSVVFLPGWWLALFLLSEAGNFPELF